MHREKRSGSLAGTRSSRSMVNRFASAIVDYKRRRLERYSHAQLLTENIIPRPAVFWRRCFSEQIGLLDTSLYYTMDYDLWLRMAAAALPAGP